MSFPDVVNTQLRHLAAKSQAQADLEQITSLRARLARAEANCKALLAVLECARKAIASLPDDALGLGVIEPRGPGDDGHRWPICNELLADIDKALGVFCPMA